MWDTTLIYANYQEILERLIARRKACATQFDNLKRSISIIDDEERASLMLVRAMATRYFFHQENCLCMLHVNSYSLLL